MSNIKWHLVILGRGPMSIRIFLWSLKKNRYLWNQQIKPEKWKMIDQTCHIISVHNPDVFDPWPSDLRHTTRIMIIFSFTPHRLSSQLASWVTPGSQYRPDNEMRKIRFVVAIFRAGPHWGHQIIITFTTLSFESQQNSRREWIFTNNYWSCEQIFFWLCFLQVLNTQLFSWNWNMQIMDVDSNFLQCSIIGWYWQSVLRAGIV